MEIRIDTKYEYDPQNDYIKVLCSVIEDGQEKLGSIIAKPRPEFFESDLQEIVGQKYADFLTQEKIKQEKITLVSQIQEGSTIELKNEEVEKLVTEIKEAQEENNTSNEEVLT